MHSEQAPYWRLSSFYFFYFASLGALVPYWSLYLKSIEFSTLEIGQLMAILYGTKVVAPNIWGWIADQTGRRMQIVRIASLLSLLTFIGVFWLDTFWGLAWVMMLFSFFWNASLPQFEATTMNHLKDDTHRYSSIRLWGSIGFIVTAWGLGVLFEFFAPTILPGVLLILFLGIWAASQWVPEDASRHLQIHHTPLGKILRQRSVLVLLAICFLMQMSHGPYYTFYTIYMGEHGYSKQLIGALWAFGVIAEIGVFMLIPRLLVRFGPVRLMVAALILTAIRWAIIGTFADNQLLVWIAQSLHAASFGIYHAVGIYLIHQYFTGKNQGFGQALYSALSFGLGGAMGSLYSGYIWSTAGGEVVYWIASGIAAFAALLAIFGLKPQKSFQPA